MANEPVKIPGGVFIDSKSGDIVESKPEEGIQLVPEGGVIDDAARGRIEAEGGVVEDGHVVGEKSEDEQEEAKTVSSKTVKGK